MLGPAEILGPHQGTDVIPAGGYKRRHGPHRTFGHTIPSLVLRLCCMEKLSHIVNTQHRGRKIGKVTFFVLGGLEFEQARAWHRPGSQLHPVTFEAKDELLHCHLKRSTAIEETRRTI